MKRNRWPLYLVIFAVVVLVITAIIKILTPPTVTITQTPFVNTNLDGSTSKLQNVQYTGPTFQAPKELPIESLTTTQSVDPARDAIVQGLGLKADTSTSWMGSGYSLALIPQLNQYQLVGQQPLKASEVIIDQNQAQVVAQDFIKKYFGQYNLTLLPNQMQYLTGADHSDTDQVTPEKAQQILFAFSYQFDKVPFFYGQLSVAPVEVVVNLNYQVQKASFSPSFYTFATLPPKPVISVEAAVVNINQGKVAITRAFQPDFQEIDLSNIASATLTSVDLQYRLDQQTRLAYPFYHFTGTAKTSAGTDLEVEMITPAVETQAK